MKRKTSTVQSCVYKYALLPPTARAAEVEKYFADARIHLASSSTTTTVRTSARGWTSREQEIEAGRNQREGLDLASPGTLYGTGAGGWTSRYNEDQRGGSDPARCPGWVVPVKTMRASGARDDR